MNQNDYLECMKEIQNKLLDFIDNEENIEENYQNLIRLLEDKKILSEKSMIQAVLYLIKSISKNHYRAHDFFTKIEKIISNIKNNILQNFTNLEIFNIFRSSKRMLLLLIELNILTINKDIALRMNSGKYKLRFYPQYFYPEIKKLDLKLNEFNTPKEFTENEEEFEEKRKTGENESEICKLIRNDSIEEFIVYVNKNEINLSSPIESSIFETNSIFNKKDVDFIQHSIYRIVEKVSLIEYAAFFGSFQIFKYLFLNRARINSNLSIYSIHGNNPEMIHFLEDQSVLGKLDKNYYESIKCFHIDIANYISSNYFNDKDIKSIEDEVLFYSIKYYNHCFIQSKSITKLNLCGFCRYNHLMPLKFILKDKNVDINILYIYKYCIL